MGWLLFAGSGLLVWAAARFAFQRGRLRTPWHRDVATLLLLALATVGCFWRVATGQNWMPADGGDLVSFLFPTYRFAAASLANGTWPLWNAHLYGGAPHISDIQAGFLYPPNLALFVLKPDFPYAALQWLSMAHIWFAGAGAYLLLARGLRVRRIAALAGALTFMFADGFFVHFGNLNYNAVMSWLPWVFWAYTANQRSGPPVASQTSAGNVRAALMHALPAAIVAGPLLAVGTLAGHIQATIFIGLALAIYGVVWAWLHRDATAPWLPAGQTLLSLALCFLLCGLLAAPILLPALELLPYTARASWDYQQAAGYSLAPSQWIGWLMPGFFGRGPQFHWGIWPRVEVGYVGILPLILAGATIALRRERRIWPWVGLALGSFVLALGIYAIPHGWLTLVPGFGQLRAPARLTLVTSFALAVLAGLGLDALLRPLEDRAAIVFERVWRGVGRGTAAVWAIAVPLAYLALLLTQDREPAIVARVALALAAVMTFAGLLAASFLWLTARRGAWAQPLTLGWLAIGLIYGDLASLGAHQDVGNQDPSLSYRQGPIVGFLQGQPGPFRIDTKTAIEREWQADTALLYGLEDVDGIANPSALADAARYWNGLASRSSPLYDLLNTRYVIARKDAPFDWNKFVLAFDGDPRLNVYENKNVLPRAFLAPQVQVVANHEAAWSAIHAADFDPRVTAVIEAASKIEVGGKGQVQEVRTGANRLTMRVAVDGPVFLVVSQVWYPGWQVLIDGRPAGTPVRTDYLFQGVVVPAGDHRVEFRFAPARWFVGWALAGVGLVALLSVGLLLRRSRGARSLEDVVQYAD